jgi:hypothetical protein
MDLMKKSLRAVVVSAVAVLALAACTRSDLTAANSTNVTSSAATSATSDDVPEVVIVASRSRVQPLVLSERTPDSVSTER